MASLEPDSDQVLEATLFVHVLAVFREDGLAGLDGDVLSLL